MSERRKLRGWGGVAGMTAACVLAVSATALPLHHQADTSAGRAGQAARDTPLTTVPVKASATGDCDNAHPETSLTPSSASGPAVDAIKARGKLIVGVDQNSYRWGYRDPNTGDIVGFDIDLVKAIAKDILGNENAVQYKTVPTKKRFEAIRDGQVDMVVRTVTISCQRINDEKVSFSSAYFKAGQQLLVPLQGSTIKDFNDTLKGKKVCTASGSTAEIKLDADPHGSKKVLVDNQLDCLVLLQLGQVDAALTDNALAAGLAAQDPAVHLIGKPVTTEYYGVAMSNKYPDLVRRVNKVLEDYRSGGSDSAWQKAYGTWLKAVFPGVEGPPEPRYEG
ncbi:glutamate ABC transporter substrate-binding protein [Streptomyces sp. NBC_01537]|uniref:glutamate ABC transporter substrate-binding protein n=1 Tax=Streptomyces sp. NBC_01537 TaxID=2903896 RepID=UPI00386B8D31